MKMPGRCTRQKILLKKFGEMGKTPSGKTRPRQKKGQKRGGINMVQKNVKDTRGKEWDQR